MIVCLAVLSKAPWMAPYQATALNALAHVEMFVTVFERPYRSKRKNLQVITTMGSAAVQMLAPILLAAGCAPH